MNLGQNKSFIETRIYKAFTIWRNKYIKSKNKYLNPNKVSVMEWMILLAIIMMSFLIFYYYDISCTVDNSLILLRAIYHGEFFHYYDYAIGRTLTVWAPNYEIFMYIIFAIWCVPLELAYHFFHIDYLHSMPAILWIKLLLLLCLFLVSYIMYKICVYLGMSQERARIAQFLFLTSVNTIIPTMVVAQCDIVNLVFMVLGIYMLLQKKRWRFIACFAVAIPLKMFALFVFVPLILLEEKRIIKALIEILCGLSGLIICKLVSWPSQAYHYLTGSFSREMIERLQKSGIEFGLGSVSIAIAGIVVICFVSYMIKADEERRSKYIIYIPFAVFAILFAFFEFFPYWIVLLAPFTILAIVNNPRFLKFNMLLEALMGLTGFFVCSLVYDWIYGVVIMDALLLSKITNYYNIPRNFYSVKDILVSFGIDRFEVAIYTIFIVSLICLLVINYPYKKNGIRTNKESIEHSVLWIRMITLFTTVGLMLMVGLSRADDVAIDTTFDSTPVAMKDSILEQGNSVIQRIKFKQDISLTKLELDFLNKADSHINVSTVTCDIIDTADNTVIYSQTLGTSMIEKKGTKLKLGIDVKKGREYEIRLTGNNDNGLRVSPMLTSEMAYEEYPVMVNGIPQEKNLYMKLYYEE